ncbi:MAG: TetR/AcrR family transcriptional regulator [Actinobacteria bacterium]|nr:TetR/AcrR family transcriptional regulator [Actinomycetota bacterium]MCB9388137.1 TetR/AcrR family transcriptional regulator [Acidimicrobiia bacterium]
MTGQLGTTVAVLEATLRCFSVSGIAKTTIDDVAAASGVSRATIYRMFQGGRDELVRDAVTLEIQRFFLRLTSAIDDAVDFASRMESAVHFAHENIQNHRLYQTMLAEEPGVLLPLLTTQSEQVRDMVAGYLAPYLKLEQQAGRTLSGVDLLAASQYVARLTISYIVNPGRDDLMNPDIVRRVVRRQMLGGILTADALSRPGEPGVPPESS